MRSGTELSTFLGVFLSTPSFIAHSLSFSCTHRPDMIEILLNRAKIASYPFTLYAILQIKIFIFSPIDVPAKSMLV